MPRNLLTTASTKPADVLRGWIKTTKDAILVFEGAKAGIVPRVTRRFHDIEKRNIIQSGAIIVFTEEESGIKRWTDPYLWSASRMQGNFLIYREREDEQDLGVTSQPPYSCSTIDASREKLEQYNDSELEHYILGSWNKGRGLKKNGLMKKTISLMMEETTYHLVSYYHPADVRSGLLKMPSCIAELETLDISQALLKSVSQFRQPPIIEIDCAGLAKYIGEKGSEISPPDTSNRPHHSASSAAYSPPHTANSLPLDTPERDISPIPHSTSQSFSHHSTKEIPNSLGSLVLSPGSENSYYCSRDSAVNNASFPQFGSLVNMACDDLPAYYLTAGAGYMVDSWPNSLGQSFLTPHDITHSIPFDTVQAPAISDTNVCGALDSHLSWQAPIIDQEVRFFSAGSFQADETDDVNYGVVPNGYHFAWMY
ncbi:Global transcription regulator sge1 [Grifola frondosa]|uniref:Global transcription regulator sge1 n=1 Tax=Grifola frondosa TaxID=5627 RepID=A0A1C7MR75_GRIFR|nr:Global transcription regulator sge1 [Grifola frondosa]